MTNLYDIESAWHCAFLPRYALSASEMQHFIPSKVTIHADLRYMVPSLSVHQKFYMSDYSHVRAQISATK